MVDFLRYAEKFESVDTLLSYTFPGDNLEYQASQDYRASLANVIGADYAHDHLSAVPWTKDVGEEAVRFEIWKTTAAEADTEFDSFVGTCRRIGTGKLYALDQAGARRWCYAKLRGRPSYIVTVDQYVNMPVEATFIRLSDWFDETATTGSQSLSASPTTFSITNPGNARVRIGLVFRLRANATGGFTDPTLENITTGESVTSSRDAASANSELRITPERMAVEYSNDNGSTYADDYTLVTLGATQATLIELEPGVNQMRYTQASGTPNAVLEYSFYAAYE